MLCITPLMVHFCRYVVDAADEEKFETARKELHDLLSKPPLAGIPLLVLGNKNDLPEALNEEGIIEKLYVSVVCANGNAVSRTLCRRGFWVAQ